MTPGIDERPLL